MDAILLEEPFGFCCKKMSCSSVCEESFLRLLTWYIGIQKRVKDKSALHCLYLDALMSH